MGGVMALTAPTVTADRLIQIPEPTDELQSELQTPVKADSRKAR
jgi:hypothetical protein